MPGWTASKPQHPRDPAGQTVRLHRFLARSSGCLADARFHLDRGMPYYPFGEGLPDLKLLLNHITEMP
jgi:hypothetical protein